MDWSPPGSSLHGISQARMEWVAIPFSGGLPDPGIEPRSPTLQADSLPSEPPGKITGINSLSVLETRGLRSRQQQGKGLPHLSQQLVGCSGFPGPKLHHPHLSASMFLPVCLCLPRPSLEDQSIGMLQLAFRVHTNPVWPQSVLITSAKTLFK